MLGGALATSVAMPGPPVAFCLIRQNSGKAAFRGNLIALFLLLLPIGLAMLLLARAALLIPALLLSVAFGYANFPRVNQHLFNRLTLVGLMALGVYTSLPALPQF